MKTPESYLKQIDRLRQKHSENFNAGRWQANDTITRQIIEAWAAYHRAVERAAK